METLTSDRIIALAPDPASVKAGQGLAQPRKWVSLGGNDKALWGECQGSGANPYQTRVELAALATKCSCPSRKFPCKHALGLMFACAGDPAKFQNGTPPPWVTEWLGQREEKAEKAVAKAEGKATPLDPVAAQAEAEKRARKREERVADGLEEMDQWIRDMIRTGLSHCQNEPPSFWNNKAARLVDAQAPGLARRVEALSTLVRTGAGWHERLLEEMSFLHLLGTAYRRLDRLPVTRQADVRRHLGWTTKQEDVLAQPGLFVDDTWQILGQVIEKEERVTTQRSWARGKTSGRFALLLSFAVAGQALEARTQAGYEFSGQLAFYDSAFPLRALVKEFRGEKSPLTSPLPGGGTIEAALSLYAHALAGDPWLETFPFVLGGVVMARTEAGWAVGEPGAAALPVSRHFGQAWKLHALGGGHPLTVIGEWDGCVLLPIGGFAERRFINFT